MRGSLEDGVAGRGNMKRKDPETETSWTSLRNDKNRAVLEPCRQTKGSVVHGARSCSAWEAVEESVYFTPHAMGSHWRVESRRMETQASLHLKSMAVLVV